MDIGRKLGEMRRGERRDTIEEIVANTIKAVLLIDPGEDLPTDLGYFDLGLTSLRLNDIRARLQDELGLEIDATVMFSRPNVEELVEHLTDEFGREPAQPEVFDAV